MPEFEKSWVRFYPEIFHAPPFLGDGILGLIYIYLIAHARTKATTTLADGKRIPLKIGQLVTSSHHISQVLGLPRTSIKNKFEKLEKWGIIGHRSVKEGTIITIEDYELNYTGASPSRSQTGHQLDTDRTPTGPHLEEIRIEENRENINYPTGNSHLGPPNDPIPSAKKLSDLWNQKVGDRLPAVRGLSTERARKAKARLTSHPDLAYWGEVIDKVLESPFCLGESERGWKASFDWLIRPNTHLKVMEGSYSGGTGVGTINIPDSFWRSLK